MQTTTQHQKGNVNCKSKMGRQHNGQTENRSIKHYIENQRLNTTSPTKNRR
jgi:hypothetical protein